MQEDTNSSNTDLYTKEEIVELLKTVVGVINNAVASENALCFRDIIAALRGPDIPPVELYPTGTLDLKHQTTAVIRAMVGITSKSGLDVNYDIDAYDNTLQEDNIHFADHIRRAENSLKTLGLWGKS